MAVKSTQVIAVRAMRDGTAVTATCRIIKYEHRKNDPVSEEVPQREVQMLNENGNLILRITKYFRHLLLECDGAFETTDKMLTLTPDNVRLLAEHLLIVPGRREQILSAAIARIEQLHALSAVDPDMDSD